MTPTPDPRILALGEQFLAVLVAVKFPKDRARALHDDIQDVMLRLKGVRQRSRNE